MKLTYNYMNNFMYFRRIFTSIFFDNLSVTSNKISRTNVFSARIKIDKYLN